MSTVNAERAGPSVGPLSLSWQAAIFTGVITVGLGIVVTVHPSTSLNVIAVLLGVLLLVAGLFQLVRALDRDASGRGWATVVGLAFVVLGVVLIRHLNVTLSLIALLIGIVWIVQGVAELFFAVGDRGPAWAWSAIFGAISLVAGIVVLAWPHTSLTTLAVLLGIWFIVIGLLQVIGGFAIRSTLARSG